MQPPMCSLPLLHKLLPFPTAYWILLVCPVGGEVEERFQGIPMKSSVAVFYSSLRMLTQEKPECPECPGAMTLLPNLGREECLQSLLCHTPAIVHMHQGTICLGNLFLYAFGTVWDRSPRPSRHHDN